jgi:hypothetical protein
MKKIHREVRFDALNMRTSRDIQCRAPVLNPGDCQIDEIQMRRMDVRKGGMIQVWVWGVSE